MANEIERKYLVQGEFRSYAVTQHQIIQGYLSSVPERSVRVRIKDEKAFITIKGKSSKNGMSRFEWEKEIDMADAKSLMKICEQGFIEKTRFIVPEKSWVSCVTNPIFSRNSSRSILSPGIPL